MSMAAIFSQRIAARTAQRRLGPFLTLEYLRIMRSRMAILIWAMMIYALLALPVITQNPQPELVHVMATWLGSDDVRAKLLLFMWVDASMNKLAMIMGPVLAGGIIVDERARGSLDLFASKPWRSALCICSQRCSPSRFRQRWLSCATASSSACWRASRCWLP
jgi:hypothetical protein